MSNFFARPTRTMENNPVAPAANQLNMMQRSHAAAPHSSGLHPIDTPHNHTSTNYNLSGHANNTFQSQSIHTNTPRPRGLNPEAPSFTPHNQYTQAATGYNNYPAELFAPTANANFNPPVPPFQAVQTANHSGAHMPPPNYYTGPQQQFWDRRNAPPHQAVQSRNQSVGERNHATPAPANYAAPQQQLRDGSIAPPQYFHPPPSYNSHSPMSGSSQYRPELNYVPQTGGPFPPFPYNNFVQGPPPFNAPIYQYRVPHGHQLQPYPDPRYQGYRHSPVAERPMAGPSQGVIQMPSQERGIQGAIASEAPDPINASSQPAEEYEFRERMHNEVNEAVAKVAAIMAGDLPASQVAESLPSIPAPAPAPPPPPPPNQEEVNLLNRVSPPESRDSSALSSLESNWGENPPDFLHQASSINADQGLVGESSSKTQDEVIRDNPGSASSDESPVPTKQPRGPGRPKKSEQDERDRLDPSRVRRRAEASARRKAEKEAAGKRKSMGKEKGKQKETKGKEKAANFQENSTIKFESGDEEEDFYSAGGEASKKTQNRRKKGSTADESEELGYDVADGERLTTRNTIVVEDRPTPMRRAASGALPGPVAKRQRVSSKEKDGERSSGIGIALNGQNHTDSSPIDLESRDDSSEDQDDEYEDDEDQESYCTPDIAEGTSVWLRIRMHCLFGGKDKGAEFCNTHKVREIEAGKVYHGSQIRNVPEGISHFLTCSTKDEPTRVTLDTQKELCLKPNEHGSISYQDLLKAFGFITESLEMDRTLLIADIPDNESDARFLEGLVTVVGTMLQPEYGPRYTGLQLPKLQEQFPDWDLQPSIELMDDFDFFVNHGAGSPYCQKVSEPWKQYVEAIAALNKRRNKDVSGFIDSFEITDTGSLIPPSMDFDPAILIVPQFLTLSALEEVQKKIREWIESHPPPHRAIPYISKEIKRKTRAEEYAYSMSTPGERRQHVSSRKLGLNEELDTDVGSNMDDEDVDEPLFHGKLYQRSGDPVVDLTRSFGFGVYETGVMWEANLEDYLSRSNS